MKAGFVLEDGVVIEPYKYFPGESIKQVKSLEAWVSSAGNPDVSALRMSMLLSGSAYVDLVLWTLDQPDDADGVKLESPLEVIFWKHHKLLNLAQLDGLVAQHPVKIDERVYQIEFSGTNVIQSAASYRLDFALPQSKICFEVDGYTYHSNREAWTKDRIRDIDLSLNGWRVFRFDGDSVRSFPEMVVMQAARLAELFA